MKVVYIAHPLGAGPDRVRNLRRARLWVCWAAELGYAPIADWIILASHWDESRREQGLAIDVELVKRCDELWLCGNRVSPGMKIEAEAAEAAGVKVRLAITADGLPPKTDIAPE